LQTGCATYLVVRGGEVNVDKLQEIKKGVTSIRGLKFKNEVAVEIKKKDEMREYLEASLLEEYGDEKLGNISLAYAKLGLFPREFDLKKSLLDFYTAQVVAFYDPKPKKLILPGDMGAGLTVGAVQFLAQRDILGEMVLAHELTHALQDQHFSLGDRIRPSSDDDRTTAFRALAEGDATLAGFNVLLGRTDNQALASMSKGIEGELKQKRSEFAGVPEALVEQLLFQYYGGVALVSRVLGEKGWAGVDRLYASPPLSTEQVLHLEKYFDQPDPPTEIELKDLPSLFPPDWREIENNNLGELMVQVLFKEFLSEDDGKLVADGWDGDRFVAFRRGDEVSFIWATVWDSPKDAEEFLEKYRELLAKKYGGDPKGAGRVYLERRDTRVVVVEGLEMKHVEENIEKIWQGMRLEETAFTRPFPAPDLPKELEAP
jgi:hypothetical protein